MDYRKYQNKHRKMMNKLGQIIVKDKSDFVSMLDTANTPYQSTEDAELIKAFVIDIPENDQLKVLTSYMLEDKVSSTPSVDNQAVYENYETIYNYWDFDVPDDYMKSNAVGAIAGAVSAGANLTNTALQGRQQRKYGATMAAQKQADAKTELLKGLIAQKQAEADKTKSIEENKSKTKRNLIIAGAVVGGLAIIGVAIYFIRKK
jgi:hypothetical protein